MNATGFQSTAQRRAATHQRLARWMWRGAYLFMGGMALFFFILSFFTPSFKELEDPNYSLASEVIGSNGEVIGRYFYENRVPVTFDSLSPYLVQALIATEDERYNDHSGIDVRALGRVMFGLVTLHPQGGGSTISQQLAKLLYSNRNFSGMNGVQKLLTLVTRKFSEWITAVKLERSYTKEEIISMYLNQFNFINGAYGIRAASEIYFGKAQNKLTLEEAAVLVGMLNNPSLYNPLRRPERVKERRNIVLSKMVRNNMITDAQFEKLKKKPLDMSHFRERTHADGIATYFRMELAKDLSDILDREECRKSDGSKYDIYKDGLKIYTTIDPEMQRLAEAAMREHMAALQKRFWQVWKGRDPWTYKESETTDAELKIRERSLERIIRESDRYQLIRSKMLDETLLKIDQENDILLQDFDIDRMLEEEQHTGFITSLINKQLIDTKKAAKYRVVMDGDHWKELTVQWQKLRVVMKKEFSKPVPMKVFAYNDKMEKDTVMTPLDSIRYHRMFLQLGSMAIDPTTGFVRAWVGGINHKYFQFDHVRTNRQVGSTIKPFVYATAIQQQGISPCFTVVDVPQTINVGEGDFRLSKSWTPKNAGSYSGHSFTLFDALKESKNTASVFLMKQLGSTEPVRGLMHEMGIDSTQKYPNGQYRVPKQPSLCLGATDLSVIDMAGAYTAFANNGTYHKPIFILRVEDKNGRLIYQDQPFEHQALQANANYVIMQMLKYVTKGSPGVNDLKSEVGGKTGTTNNYVDGWFMGLTPRLVVGTWVGGEDPWIRFLSIGDGQGSHMARPFFSKLMHAIEKDKEVDYDVNAHFERPPGDLGIEIDCNQFRQENGIPNDGSEFFNDPFSDEESDGTQAGGQKATKPKADAFGDEL